MELSYSDYWEYHEDLAKEFWSEAHGYIDLDLCKKQAMDHMNKCGYSINPYKENMKPIDF